MKTATLVKAHRIVLRVGDPDKPGALMEQTYLLKEHAYPLPAERSNIYNRLMKERDARNPESFLEPEQGKLMAADIDYEYNYYSPNYEQLQFLYPTAPVQNVIPDLNLFLASEARILHAGHSERQIVSPLGDIIRVSEYYDAQYGVQGALESAAFNKNMVLSKEYFEDFGHAAFRHYTNFPSEPTNVHTFVNKPAQKVLLDVENKREHFPFFGKINVEGFENSQVANILEDYKLDEKFMMYLLALRDSSLAPELTYQVDDDTIKKTAIIYPYEEFVSLVIQNPDIGVMRPKNIAKDLNSFTIKFLRDAFPETDAGLRTLESSTNCSAIEDFLHATIAKTKLEKYIHSAPEGASTPVAFKLEKRDLETNNLMSSHYFFNYKDTNNFKLFDTQVVYDREYQYDIKIINSVVVVDQSTGKKSMIFMEEFFYQDSFYILDSPPIAPDVELITYRGVSDKLLILFNQMIDQKAMVPIYINESDRETFEKQYKAQKIPQPDPIMFESDDPTNFELFKCLKHPSEYSEFANTFYKNINSGGKTAASYTDTIIPNQTYYYMFRALDMHGFTSNPSPIYEFTLIKEGETMYPKIRTVELAKPDPPVQKEKSFKKYLKIGYSAQQMQIEPNLVSQLGDELIGKPIDIGTADDKIIGSQRKFKFRIKSKNTGKLIDINVTFKKNKVIKA